MREIKFRAWHKINKEYEFFDFSNIYGYEGEVCGVLLPSGDLLNGNSGYGDGPININLLIEQYTGLSDKNGKEIYEGDILKMFPGFGCTWKERIATVNYRPASFWVDFGGQSFILDDHDCSFEIIGNIHQTPELLEV